MGSYLVLGPNILLFKPIHMNACFCQYLRLEIPGADLVSDSDAAGEDDTGTAEGDLVEAEEGRGQVQWR